MFLKASEGRAIADALIRTIQQNKDYLSEIDGKIGDGDHGVNLNKGFTMCEKRLAGQRPTVSDALLTISQTLMEDIGGSMGPLYGTLFDGMGSACEGKDEIDAATFEEMLREAVAGVQDIGKANRGDKTLLDTLIPAQEAFSAAIGEGKDFALALEDMKTAAERGWRSTEDMVAKIGRAARLGERSRGVLDAGATSCWLLLTALADSIRANLIGLF